jgi:hypothetical protein
MNEMPIQCDGFAIKSCSHGLRELLGAPSVEGTRIEALQRHFVLNDSIITARDTGTNFFKQIECKWEHGANGLHPDPMQTLHQVVRHKTLCLQYSTVHSRTT